MNDVVLRGDKKCPHGHTARGKCDVCDREDDQAEIAQLRGNLSLAEEGLANYAQEVAHLRAYQLQMNNILKENERLQAALQHYGSHEAECDAGFDLSDHCTCGYTDAVRGAVPQTERHE